MKTQIKNIIAVAFFLLIGSSGAMAQDAAKILKSYKGENETMMINIPGFIAKIALNTQDIDKEYKQAMKKVRGVKIFISEESNAKLQSSMMRDFNKLFKKKNYESLMQIKSDGDIININFKQPQKNKKGELVLLVQSDDELVAVIIEGKFTENDMRSLAKNINTNNF